ncbi:hypothetical protein BDV09DRAFT_191913 [Aspergillus tetrazonus]
MKDRLEERRMRRRFVPPARDLAVHGCHAGDLAFVVIVEDVDLSKCAQEFTPDILDNGVAATCAQYGIPIVAYSPNGRARPNWAIAQLRRLNTTIVPVAGLSTPEREEENSKIMEVSDEQLDQIDAIVKSFTPAGERYPPIFQTNT